MSYATSFLDGFICVLPQLNIFGGENEQ